MSRSLQKIKREKDLGPAVLILAGVVLVGIKLLLCSAQRLYLTPGQAPIDDDLMYNAAVSITRGDWLGDYGWLTLSKHSFFSLWVAALHRLGVPYLLGGNLLWAGASLAGAWALAPALKKRWVSLALFALLLFCPSSVANPENYGYMMRVYRDNIFPALCVLVVAGMVGYALRWGQKLRCSLGWPVLAGLGFAACWLSREDGWWLLPFVLAAAAATAVFVLRNKAQNLRQKLARLLALALPFALLWGGVLGWSAANGAHYGRFVLNDFYSGEFADAYGAMTRIEHESWDPKIAVPADVRAQLYEHLPAFAELQPILDSEWYMGRYAPYGDYQSGAFYWALREAAAELGHYDTPQASRAYWSQMAEAINALCDDGTLKASGLRSSVSPPIRAAYILPVLREGTYSLWFCATFQQCDPQPIFSPGSNDPAYYEAAIQPMEVFLGDVAQTATLENSTEPYLNTWQKICFGALEAMRFVYALLLPAGLLAALAWLLAAGARCFKRLRARQKAPMESLVWVVGLGLLACILLRVLMIAFVTVSSFDIGTYVMYLASVHPLMVMLATLGVARGAIWLAGWRREMRQARQNRRAEN